MKLNKFALTLTAAALLPTFTFAGTDQVAASFERDLQRGMNIESVAVAKAGSVDPLVYAIDVALNGHSDQVLASFERDLYREPTLSPTVLASQVADPLAGAINVALNGSSNVAVAKVETIDPLVYAIDVALNGHSDQVLASFERDLHRVPTIPGVVLTASAEVDPLTAAINVALWGEAGKPAVSIATAGGHHHGS